MPYNQEVHSLSNDHSERWPARCCVPAFVAAAVRQLSGERLGMRDLAHRLGVVVAPTDANPFDLPVRAVEPGAQVPVVLTLIPRVLQEISPDLAFRHLPLSHVTLGLYEDVVLEFWKRGSVVGLGLDYRELSSAEGAAAPLKHVVRLTQFDPQDRRYIFCLDDEAGGDDAKRVRWDSLEIASRRINDGFWIIGRRGTLHVPWTPSSSGETSTAAS